VKSLCFTTYVFGWYQDYIPTYVYSILLAFPQHFVKIFLKEKLSDKNKHALDLVRKQVSNSFEIIEEFTDLDHCGLEHLPSLRFVMTRDYFEGFDYVYFGDVDFVIYNEKDDNFYERYIDHCNQTKLPFSNEWNYDKGRFRMTGLHFIQKDAYFDVMDPFIEDMKKPDGNDFRRECGFSKKSAPSYDEEMLYYMTTHAFDLRPLTGYLRPFHGLHFGTFRVGIYSWFAANQWSRNTNLKAEGLVKRYLPTWWEDKDKIDAVMGSPLFDELYGLMCDEAQTTVTKAKNHVFTKLFG